MYKIYYHMKNSKNQNSLRTKSNQTPNFIGEYHYTLDEKNRLTVPTKFRHFFASGGVVTKGVDTCLFLFTEAEWQTLATQIASLSMTQGNNRAYSRMLLGGAMDVELDAGSRIILPEYLRQYAGLKKEVVLVGLFRRLELWDLATWQGYKARIEADSPNIAESLAQISL